MGRSQSRSEDRKKKDKKDKKHKKEKKNQQQKSEDQKEPAKKEEKERPRKEKKEKKNRQRSKQRSRSRSRQQRQRPRQPQRPRKEEKQRSPSPIKSKIEDEERLRKIAMRQVRARLLKFNFKDDDSQQSEKQQKKPIPPPIPTSSITKPIQPQKQAPVKRKQSKWGKVSSNQPSISSFVPDNSNDIKKQTESASLSLQLEHSQDPLKLSQDKSMDLEQEHQGPLKSQLQKIQQQQVDPLDQYMMELEGAAAPQMELALKPKANVISFEEIVTCTFSSMEDEVKNTLTAEQDDDKEEEVRKNFLTAISKLEEIKEYHRNDERGVLMENNEENREAAEQFQQEREPQLDFFAKQRRLAERKQLGQVDHSKIVYQEVRFNLYRQAEQVKNYNPKEVQKYRKQAGDIKVRGKDVLNPVFNWYHCGYSDKILSIIEKRQYKKPFPIQAQSMPLLLSGRDVIGIAQTGSGKTLAYLLPAIKHIQDQPRVEQGQGPISIIMTPTRQLARQVYLQAKHFCKPMGIRVIAVYGGQSVQNQLADFRIGAELVVCTPGRMIDILTLNKGKVTNLKRVTLLIIDEADRMFDLGFQPQITRIIDNIRPKRQIALFSATFPKNVQILARKILTKPVQIIVGSRGQACANVQQIVLVIQQSTKLWRLLEILGTWHQKGSILIFVDKQTQGDYLFQELLKYGYHSLVLHGAMDPDDRQFTIYDFKKGVQTIMIATSVCARGLDIRSIVLVVNFKCPNHLEDYIHRIGRTGRGGNKGTAITFITPAEEQYSIDLLKALQMAQIHPPQQLIKLSQTYLSKVKKGQARKIRNRNIMGSGFKFDEDEQEKVGALKDMIKRQMKSEGLGFDDSDDDDIQLKKKKEQDLRGRNHQQRIAEAIKNPEIKNKLLNQAVKAVSQAIKNGSAITTEKLLEIAVGSMRESVTKYKVVNSVNDGVEQVTKLINSFQTKQGGEGSDFFSYDFQINDYPLGARQKACNQQFLHGIQHQTNCSISLRGVFVEPGKKAQVGCRKLYLHIQGENKYYVTEAYKQIKQVLEETAYENMHMGLAPGKYSL